jgi:TonB family protein
MLKHTFTVFAMVLAISCGPAVILHAGDPESLQTRFTILVGFPSGETPASSGVLLVPGTVIPISVDGAGSADERESLVERSIAFTTAVDKLWSTFRLDPDRKQQTATYQDAVVDRPLTLPGPAANQVSIVATLLGYNDSAGTYRIVFQQGERSLADSTVNVTRGGRAVVGGMDGPAAPYLFVFVEPDPYAAGAPDTLRYQEGIGITEPVKTDTVRPAYPDSARRDKVMGVVVIELLIDTKGKVVDHRLLRSPDARLAESSIAAVRQWRFEPARRADGTAVKVWYVITVKYNLK